jgi:flagellin
MAYSSGARINTNIAAYNALNALNNINGQLSVHQLRLATGKRVNSAQDDASGYVISQKMYARIGSLQAALDNVGDAQSVLNTAQGGMQTISDLLVQMQQQQTRFNNGTWSSDEKNAIASNMEQLRQEIVDTINGTKFNGVALLNGQFQNGTSSAVGGSTVINDVANSTAYTGSASADATNVGITSVDVSQAKSDYTYTFAAGTDNNGNDIVTLTANDGTSDVGSQSIVMDAQATAGGSQSLNFSSLGVKVTIASLADNVTAATMAGGLDGLVIDTITGGGAPKVDTANSGVFAGAAFADVNATGVDVSGANANYTYTFAAGTDANGKDILTLTANDGTADVASQSVIVSKADKAGDTQTLNFSALGVKVSLQAVADSTSAATIAGDLNTLAIATITGGSAASASTTTSSSFQVGDQLSDTIRLDQTSSGSDVIGNLTKTLSDLYSLAGGVTASNAGGSSAFDMSKDLSEVTAAIGNIGSMLNRLDVKTTNLNTAITNTQAAASRIVDADVASEQIQASKLQILQQTSTAELAQANQSPQVFLSLFK